MENLNELGLVEMGQEEMNEIDGGVMQYICDNDCGWVWWNSETGSCHSMIGNECY
ncbi:hypothetical protein SAMN04488028_104317 [Reichenbachiella agariperforans]|uniref:Uncharacterized protein n=1 Tax=Reichenbachiella agariperforans TaxID=156994 RepID=A0A1M6RWU6_REIAG|nr:hypothetical protein SAMN04488028_104317 [Reichenbachiella agariperforans]